MKSHRIPLTVAQSIAESQSLIQNDPFTETVSLAIRLAEAGAGKILGLDLWLFLVIVGVILICAISAVIVIAIWRKSSSEVPAPEKSADPTTSFCTSSRIEEEMALAHADFANPLAEDEEALASDEFSEHDCPEML
jgi:hypothetical protein